MTHIDNMLIVKGVGREAVVEALCSSFLISNIILCGNVLPLM